MKMHTKFVGNPYEKRLLGRPRRRWEVNIEMHPTQIGFDSVDCV
jgi:hypothetical protein